MEIVVNGKPTDDTIVRKSLGLTLVLRMTHVGVDIHHLCTDL